MNRKLSSWNYLTVPALVIAGLGASGCDEAQKAAEEACGPCGEIAKGDVSISGDARIDAFFSAVGTLQTATDAIKADFDAQISALAALNDIDVSVGIDASIVETLNGKIKGEIATNVD